MVVEMDERVSFLYLVVVENFANKQKLDWSLNDLENFQVSESMHGQAQTSSHRACELSIFYT